tara:strand:+ start:8704 stop:8982 length:279 start_codon:yes stop_codon:yes gene_type:complete
MALSDVIAVTRTSDGTIFGGRARVKQVVVHTSSSGSPAVVLKDGGSGGTTKLSLTYTTSDVHSLNIPENGILFETDVYLDLTACDGVTVFFA